jgi:hypothetical protein
MSFSVGVCLFGAVRSRCGTTLDWFLVSFSLLKLALLVDETRTLNQEAL